MSIKVLLADGSPAAARAVEAALPGPEFEVRTVDDGSKAVLALADFRPDAVLAAQALPLPGGVELGAVLRENPALKTTALIFLQGVVELLDVGRLAAVDHDGVVRKPFDSRSLARLVRQAVERRRELPSLPEEPVVEAPRDPVGEPGGPPERITTSLGLDGTPLEQTLRGLVQEEVARTPWEARMREIAAAEFKKLLVHELREADPKSAKRN